MNNTGKRKKTIGKYIVQILLFGFVGLIAFLLIAFTLFFINKDKISSKVLLETNNYAQGDIQFNDIKFNPFVQFPKISLTLSDVEYFENPASLRDSLEIPICDLEYLHASIDILDLLSNKITISSIIAENGLVNIITHSDSSSNIQNAFQPINQSVESDTVQKVRNDLLLNHIIFNDIDVHYLSKKNSKAISISINKLESSLSIKTDTIIASLKLDFLINDIQLDEPEIITNKPIIIQSSVVINTKELGFQILDGNIQFDKIFFKIKGLVNLANERGVDLVFDAENTDMKLFGLMLNNYGFDNLKKGEVYVNGTVKGNFLERIPVLKCWFGVRNMEIEIPETEQSISDFNLSGSFVSGDNPDFSLAILRVDSLTSLLPNGYLNGYLQITNFKKPEINYLVDLKTDLNYFQKIFSLNKIDSLNGTFELFSQMSNSTFNSFSEIHKTIPFASITFDSLSFVIPNKIEINKIDGNISGNLDTLCINNLSAIIGNSDFYINGSIYNSSNLFDTILNDFTTDLRISSQLFDLTDFLNYRENVGEGFPYQITDLDINLSAISNKERLFNSIPVPDISFNIHQLNCNVNKLLPPIILKNVDFELGNLDDDLYLEFSDFTAMLDAGELTGNVIYHEPYLKDMYVEIDAEIDDFNPAEFFNRNPNQEVQNMLLNGDAYCKLSFTQDTNVIFSSLDFSSDKLTYQTDSANYQVNNLNIISDYISYNTDVIKNPLVTLSTNMNIDASGIKYNNLKIDSINYTVNINQGDFTFIPNSSWLFFDNVSGYISLNPFIKPLNFEVDLKVEQLKVDEFLEQFIEDTIVEGNIDAEIRLSGNGDSINEILKSLNGEVKLESDNLFVYGIDLDDLLVRIERSQHFNLVDVGAMLLAGPIGLAVTKGTDYTRVLLVDKELNTNVNKFVSIWDFRNGILISKDVALSSKNHLIAANGWLNIVGDSINITVAIVDEKGCSSLSQDISGALSKPEMGKLVIIKSLIAPVTNLLKVESKCEPFYTGKVKYPESED